MNGQARPCIPPATVVGLLVVLLGLQPITTDLYLPALPNLPRELGASVGAVQQTLSVLIVCFGVAQLVCGPLADRFGRRPVLLWGMSLYTAASIGGALASSVGTLIFWRALQGAAMAAAVVCGRSIVRDLYAPHEGAHVLSRALSGLGLIAMLSPLVGGVLVQWFDWHAALLALALFGAATLAFIALRYDESVPARRRDALQLRPLLRNWAALLAHPTFRAWALLSALAYGGLFVFLSASSFVYIDVLGVSRIGYGLVLASNSLVYIGGTVLCRRWLVSHGLRGTVRRGAVFTLTGGALMAVIGLTGWASVPALLLPQWLFALGHGIHQPCGQAGAVGPFPEKAGTAASLSGFGMMAAAYGSGTVVGGALDGTVRPMALGIATFSALLAAVAFTLIQRHGEPSQRAAAAAVAVPDAAV